MKDNTFYAIIVICCSILVGGLIWVLSEYAKGVEQHGYELRKSYVDKCQVSPGQAEKLYPNGRSTTP